MLSETALQIAREMVGEPITKFLVYEHGNEVNRVARIIDRHLAALTAELSAASEEVAKLRSRLDDAMRFVPSPEQMSGYDDPDCPIDVRELIEVARRLRTPTKETA